MMSQSEPRFATTLVAFGKPLPDTFASKYADKTNEGGERFISVQFIV